MLERTPTPFWGRSLFCVYGPVNRNEIIDIVYALKEGDDDGWETTSDEYLAARKYCNTAINLWEYYENTIWRELWGTLTDAADGTKTTSADTYSYACPTNMRMPASWVRIGGTYFTVVPPEKKAGLANSDSPFVYFTGSQSIGFTLHINPRLTVSAGGTIEYEYYKQASTFTATTSKTELSDPYFIVYFVLAQFLFLDGEDYSGAETLYQKKLDDMQTLNMSGYYGIPDPLDDNDVQGGFGE